MNYLSIEEKMNKAELSADDLYDLFVDYVKNNLDEFASGVTSSNNYVIRYWIDKEKVSSTIMASDNWQEQPETDSKCIELFNKASSSRWDWEPSVILDDLRYIFTYIDDHYLAKKFDRYKDDILSGEKDKELLDNSKLLNKMFQCEGHIALTVAKKEGFLTQELPPKNDFTHKFIMGGN